MGGGGEQNLSGMKKQHVNKERIDPEGNYLHLRVSVFSKILLNCPTVLSSRGEPNWGAYWPRRLMENGLASACLGCLES